MSSVFKVHLHKLISNNLYVLLILFSVFFLIYLGWIYAEPIFDFSFGSVGNDDGQFKAPIGIALDSAGN
ncbi:hypothetical protein, partial [Nitrosopumilus sp.]